MTKLETKIEVGKPFYVLESVHGFHIKKDICKTIEISENGIFVSGQQYGYNIKDCYRFLSDMKLAVEKAINDHEHITFARLDTSRDSTDAVGYMCAQMETE